MWRDVAKALADQGGYRVVALDFFGRGASPWPGKNERLVDCTDSVFCSEALLVEQSVDLLSHLQISCVELLIGHSMGGGTAIALASRHPALVRRLLVTAPVGLPKSAGSSFSFPGPLRRLLMYRSLFIGKKLSTHYWVSSGRSAGIALGQAEDFVDREKHPNKSAEQVQIAADNLKHDQEGFVDAWLSSLRNFPLGYGAPSGDLVADYKALGMRTTLPVTLIWGAEDTTCPIKGFGEALVKQLIPHARLLVMENAGHAVVYEEAKVVAREISTLLSSSC